MTALLLAALLAAAPITKCFDNLCGMDSYCSCHEAGTERRCWSQPADCEVDRACCADTKSCKSTPFRGETCGQRTSDERKKRDAKP